MIRFSLEAKTPLVNGGGEDREVAVPGPPKMGLGLLQLSEPRNGNEDEEYFR
jgi:hypothetical protein